jgi:hypothetical protein
MTEQDETLVEFVTVLMLLGVSPDDLKEMKETVNISVPFPKTVLDKFMNFSSDEKTIRRTIADIMYVVFVNALIDCVRNNENEIRANIVKGQIKQTVSMN